MSDSEQSFKIPDLEKEIKKLEKPDGFIVLLWVIFGITLLVGFFSFPSILFGKRSFLPIVLILVTTIIVMNVYYGRRKNTAIALKVQLEGIRSSSRDSKEVVKALTKKEEVVEEVSKKVKKSKSKN